jgi:hypothetical protein
MKRALKMVVVAGGISALVWGLRNRVRVAIGWGEGSDVPFNIIEPDTREPDEGAPDGMEADTGAQASADDPPQNSGATDAAG